MQQQQDRLDVTDSADFEAFLIMTESKMYSLYETIGTSATDHFRADADLVDVLGDETAFGTANSDGDAEDATTRTSSADYFTLAANLETPLYTAELDASVMGTSTPDNLVVAARPSPSMIGSTTLLVLAAALGSTNPLT